MTTTFSGSRFGSRFPMSRRHIWRMWLKMLPACIFEMKQDRNPHLFPTRLTTTSETKDDGPGLMAYHPLFPRIILAAFTLPLPQICGERPFSGLRSGVCRSTTQLSTTRFDFYLRVSLPFIPIASRSLSLSPYPNI